MDLDLGPMASMIGVSIPVFRFLLCFVATIPVSFIWRLIPGGPFGKNTYAALTGVILSYLSFGFSSNLHFLVLMAVGYVSMVLYRQRCGLVTFFLAMGYLIGWYVFYPLDYINVIMYNCVSVFIICFFNHYFDFF